MDLLRKPNSEFSPSMPGEYEKPRICPCCGDGNDASPRQNKILPMGDYRSALVSVFQCTGCKSYFLVANYRDSRESNDARFACMFPAYGVSFKSEILKKFSPRFISMYTQALRSEAVGDFDLAVCGFRSAIEILIKDYAVNELGEQEESVSKLSFAQAVERYLGSETMVSSADVVRILGNDRVHYKAKYSEYGFDVVKKYVEIFIQQMECLYLCAHPPVSRHTQPDRPRQ